MQNESIGMVIQSLGEGHGRGLLDNGFLALPLFAIMGVGVAHCINNSHLGEEAEVGSRLRRIEDHLVVSYERPNPLLDYDQGVPRQAIPLHKNPLGRRTSYRS